VRPLFHGTFAMSVLRLAGPIFLTLLLASLSALAPAAGDRPGTAIYRGSAPVVTVLAGPESSPVSPGNRSLVARVVPAASASHWNGIVPNAGENIPEMGQ